MTRTGTGLTSAGWSSVLSSAARAQTFQPNSGDEVCGTDFSHLWQQRCWPAPHSDRPSQQVEVVALAVERAQAQAQAQAPQERAQAAPRRASERQLAALGLAKAPLPMRAPNRQLPAKAPLRTRKRPDKVNPSRGCRPAILRKHKRGEIRGPEQRRMGSRLAPPDRGWAPRSSPSTRGANRSLHYRLRQAEIFAQRLALIFSMEQ